MKRAITLGLLLAGQAWATDHAGGRNYPGGSGGLNAPWQQDKPYVVLVSIDGYRWDYPDLYPSPSIQRLIAEGVRAERLVPAWPSLTFPNHYTLVTGLPPSRHGVVSNDFFDRKMDRWYQISDRTAVQDGAFYGGEPIWVTAETQGMVAASYFWVGSEADVMGVRPTHWRAYDKKVAGSARVDQTLAWLAEPAASRPHAYTLYFEEVDDYAHWYGPGSSEFLAAVDRVDASLARLLAGIARLPHADQVNVIIVSDHGQMPYRDEPPFILNEHIPLRGLSLIDGGPYVFAWQDQPDPQRAQTMADHVNQVWEHGMAYTRASAPVEWQLNGNTRNPDLIFQARAGYGVISSAEKSGKITAGDHGWAPDEPHMHGIFIGWGPQVDKNWHPGALRTQDVYPLLLDILDLQAPAK